MKTTLTILGLALLILPAQGAALNTYPETNAAANVQLLGIVTNADGSFTTVRVPSVGGTDPALVTNGQTTFKMTNLTGSGSVIMAATSSGLAIQAQNTNGSFGNMTIDTNGVVTAQSFVGLGSGLTNIPASKLVNTAGQQVSLTNVANVFAGTFTGNASGLVGLQATNVVGNALPAGTLAITNWVSFAAPEVVLTNSVTFVGATNQPPAGWVAYVNVAVWGNGITVGWPMQWSPSGTNSVTLTNGLVAFRAYGTNITAAYLQP